ncbi:response regulator [Sphingomonas sp. RG327]|jgi:signal transduction histidine kinase|uniref:histidine kinase n=1 Tax=Sphingomonas anseongensis TaxID=2908207 RepID=A0ABT0RCU6_9SPHN|nr:response regulator [Sphingomonas anseongensis]MCL6678054.1 response regulator [Sphingomonas anseongensis]
MNRPIGEIPAIPQAEVASPSAAEEPQRARVLLVDDDERNLLALATVLEDLGEVVLARSGEEALRHLLKGEFAVILLDVYMPGIDGYETAQIIRARDQTKGIPIVFLSAVNKEAEHLIRGYSMGAVDYVFKPVDPIILRSKVAVFVDLFEKTKEIERKARHEQALLDANLRANAERLRAEQELRRAEQRQAAIIQSLPMVLYLEPYDSTRRTPNFLSGDVEAITGISYQKLKADPAMWFERLHPDDRNKVTSALKVRSAAGRFSIEYRWQCADGSYKHFLDQAVLLKDPDGRPIEFAGTITDITDQRSLEMQLVQAQKMDAIGKLTGGIAHDFNNLLAAVIGGVSLLEKKATLDKEQQRILGMTKRAAEQGSDLVRRLLAFARRQNLEPQPVELDALRQAVSDLLTHTLGGLVEIDWKIADGVADAFVDQAQLELALLNLIINARDAMPDGGTVTIIAENCSVEADSDSGAEPGDYVRIAVRDTGTGIPPDVLANVMDPFFTTKAVGKGSGLGLSMVYGFAKQSNGAFLIESEVGSGTLAELLLPRAPEGAARSEPPAPKRATRKKSRKLNILLVDDHTQVRNTTAALLEDLGHVVAQAPDGAQALEILKNRECDFDLLISDYAMPQLSGTDFLRQARVLCPAVPALIVTGYADADAIGDRAEGISILQKPFTASALESEIANLCDSGSTTEPKKSGTPVYNKA